MTACSISGCDGKHYGRGFCRKHYMRNRVHGDPYMNARQLRTTISDRFWKKVEKTSDCWNWVGCKDAKGYGEIGVGGKRGTAFAHRVSFELHNGQIPVGLHVLHRCDNPSCVRPDHLFLGTHSDNMQDMWEKGRGRCDGAGRRGSANGNHRLTEPQVIEIRSRVSSGATRRGLAREFNVSKTLISLIANGAVWTHLLGASQ